LEIIGRPDAQGGARSVAHNPPSKGKQHATF
jgi:hypothetical protein